VQLPDWRCFNTATGGFRPREFTILCGSTGSGKTTWLSNLSAQLLKARVKHFVMSVETGHTDFMKRIMSVLSGKDLNTGDPVSPEVLKRVNDNYAPLFYSQDIEFSLYDNRVKLGQLVHDLEFMNSIKGCKVAMIDNLNFFLDVTTAANAVIEVDKVIHELIMFCKRADMHVIMVMHPKKTDHGRVESEFDIKGSSTAVQEAHNVLLFNRLPKEQLMRPEDSLVRELKIAKMRRRGKFVGKAIIYDSQETRYVERGMQ
jgi:twinkle protein